jgi:hypothetical protein
VMMTEAVKNSQILKRLIFGPSWSVTLTQMGPHVVCPSDACVTQLKVRTQKETLDNQSRVVGRDWWMGYNTNVEQSQLLIKLANPSTNLNHFS